MLPNFLKCGIKQLKIRTKPHTQKREEDRKHNNCFNKELVENIETVSEFQYLGLLIANLDFDWEAVNYN